GGRALRLAYGDLAFEVETEGRDQVCAGDQRILVDGIAYRGRVGASGEAVTAIAAALLDGLEVHVQVQDGIDVDEVGKSSGNLVTGAVGDGVTRRQLAGRHSLGAGVEAERDGGARTLEEVLRFQQDVSPGRAIWRRHAGVQREGLFLREFA